VPPETDSEMFSDPHVVFAVNDLAERMDRAPTDIRLVAREEVTWRDGSLGCPQPGMRYTQALVDGYKITLEFQGITYAYHGRAGRDPFFCPNEPTIDKGGSPVTLVPKEESTGDDLDTEGSVDE